MNYSIKTPSGARLTICAPVRSTVHEQEEIVSKQDICQHPNVDENGRCLDRLLKSGV